MPPPRKKKPQPPKKRQTSRTKKPPQSSKARTPFFMVLYSPGGAGKTTFAAQAPSPAFIHDAHEDGINILSQERQVPKPVYTQSLPIKSESWNLLLDTSSIPDSAETIVYESITGLEMIAQQYHCETEYNGNWNLFSKYARGRKEVAKNLWPEFIQVLKDLRNEGKNVILTAHSIDKEVTESDGTVYLKQKVYCDLDLWMVTYKAATVVAFLDIDVDEDKKERGLKRVAKSDISRYLHTCRSSWNDCKCWHKWPPVIDLGYEASESWKCFEEGLR